MRILLTLAFLLIGCQQHKEKPSIQVPVDKPRPEVIIFQIVADEHGNIFQLRTDIVRR